MYNNHESREGTGSMKITAIP